jgi:sulfofructose kinase
MRRANAVAALSCRGLDGQSKIPTTTELDAYLEAH